MSKPARYFVTAEYKRSNGKPWLSGSYTTSEYVGSYPTLSGSKRKASARCLELANLDALIDIHVNVRDPEKGSLPIFTYTAKAS